MRARQIAQSGALGEILQFRAAFLHGGSANPDAPLKWKLQAAAGGGVVADLGSHVLDLVNTLVGDLAALNATTSIAYPDRPAPGDPSTRVPVDAEDCMLVLGRLANGAVGSIEATKLATGSEDELRVEIHGSTGALRYNSMDPHHLELYDADAPDRPLGGTRGWTRIDAGQRYPAPAGFPGPKLSIGWLRSHVQCLYEFLAAVHEGRVADPGLAQGIYIQRLMAAVLSSARERTWIAGPERPAL
jgi:predicted dehydrogenase